MHTPEVIERTPDLAKRAFSKLRLRERGATAVEYGLIVALIAGVIVAIVGSVGGGVNSAFSTANSGLGDVSGASESAQPSYYDDYGTCMIWLSSAHETCSATWASSSFMPLQLEMFAQANGFDTWADYQNDLGQ